MPFPLFLSQGAKNRNIMEERRRRNAARFSVLAVGCLMNEANMPGEIAALRDA
ncbi:hypothetical protein GJAV_G00181330 [Gymnothorax javanicus]|nr:hypothetical protein GJAV_G00181330 [Gymnothorax javanicus]